MKKIALFIAMVAGSCTYNCFAQSNDRFLDSEKMEVSQITTNNDLAVVSYHVEERINMRFGGSITTYDVSDLSMISKNDLGENNVRIITPKYAKIRPRVEPISIISEQTKPSNPEIIANPVTTSLIVRVEAKKDFANIDVIDTYERVMDKGYKSVVMLTKVADRHFFEGDLVLAAKWYSELFNTVKTDLEAVYYYRYGQSLIATGQTQKGNEMMKIFEAKSL